MNIVGILSGARTFLCRVSERSYSLELHLLEKLGQLHAVAQIASVMREILRDEIQLAGSLHLEELCFTNKLAEREGAVLAAHERNGAECAAVIAPFADLHVAHVWQVASVQTHSR